MKNQEKDSNISNKSLNSAPLVFNTNTNRNDLSGNFEGSVYFCQSQVIPATIQEGDKQPTLVANRNTLVIVKPALNIQSLHVIIRVGGSGQVRIVTLNPPEDLPKVNPPALLLEPEAGSTYIINSQAEMTLLESRTTNFLSGLLENHSLVEIHTANGQWVRHIFLPERTISGRMVTIRSDATTHTIVNHGDGVTHISTYSFTKFKFVNNKWLVESEGYNENIAYIDNAWSGIILAEYIQPDSIFSFTDGSSTSNLKHNIKIGSPSELLINTIDIGMLTPPRNLFTFAEYPELHRQYYQTIPTSRMTVSDYQSVYLKEAMLPNGTFYTEQASGIGDWHNGILREYIARGLISLGINFANYGLNSSTGGRGGYFYNAAQVTVGNSVGMYENGSQIHGGSGGSGMAMLDESTGNEFSHELGHAYSLSHFPGGFNGSVHRSADSMNSTWGWDADINIFLPNFSTQASGNPTCLDGSCQQPFHGYSFGFDPMAGGHVMGPFNNFTLHTPYSSVLTQDFFERKLIFSNESPTGFNLWNPITNTMDPYEHRINLNPLQIISNDDLSEETIASLLSSNSAIEIALRDGDWQKEIHIPLANASNNGRIISIDDYAGFRSYLFINGEPAIEMERNFQARYKSDGTLWNEIILLDQRMVRVSARPAENTITTYLDEYVKYYDIVEVESKTGQVFSLVTVPPANESNARKIILVTNNTFINTVLTINGLQRTLTYRQSAYYISDGNDWVEKSEFVDLLTQRTPSGFGVPVTTLIGYYDPEETLPHYIYPALHGAYGYIYDDDGVSLASRWQVWVESDSETLRFHLSGSRIAPGLMNKFHINIPENNRRRTVSLVRDGVKILTKDIEPVTSALKYTVNGILQTV